MHRGIGVTTIHNNPSLSWTNESCKLKVEN